MLSRQSYGATGHIKSNVYCNDGATVVGCIGNDNDGENVQIIEFHVCFSHVISIHNSHILLNKICPFKKKIKY